MISFDIHEKDTFWGLRKNAKLSVSLIDKPASIY